MKMILLYIAIVFGQLMLFGIAGLDKDSNLSFLGILILLSAIFPLIIFLLTPNKSKFKIFENKTFGIIFCVLPILSFSFFSFASIIFLYKRYHSKGLEYLKKENKKEDLNHGTLLLFKVSNELIHRAYERYDADRKIPKIEPKEIKEEDNEEFIKLEEEKTAIETNEINNKIELPNIVEEEPVKEKIEDTKAKVNTPVNNKKKSLKLSKLGKAVKEDLKNILSINSK
ncbi:hypothetical protein OA100_00535 [Alphaproteobacteria bacterium]|nr:hypothetical protein [Alphaproteobacteria bacterium]